MTKFLIILLHLFISDVYAIDKAEYDIVIFNKTIGNTIVEKKILKDGGIEYIFRSNAAAKVFFKERTSSADISVIYKNGVMHSANCNYERDGEKFYVEMKKVNEFYEIKNNDKFIKEQNPINFSVTKLFFEEPIGIDKVWVERLSEYTDLEKIDEHKYRVEVEGKYNFYTYENAVLVEYMNKNIVNVYMHLNG